MTPINVGFQYKQKRLYLEMNAICKHGKTNSPALINMRKEIENKADTLQAEFGIFENEQNFSLILQKNV
jgi:hypothetical protein